MSDDWLGLRPSVLAEGKEQQQHRFLCTIIKEKDDGVEAIVKDMMEAAKEEFGAARVQFWYQLKDGQKKRDCDDADADATAAGIALVPKRAPLLEIERRELVEEMEQRMEKYQRIGDKEMAKWVKRLLVFVILVAVLMRFT